MEYSIACIEKPSEWLRIFHEIWDNPHRVSEIKKENEVYIGRMNSYIISQFSNFLNG